MKLYWEGETPSSRDAVGMIPFWMENGSAERRPPWPLKLGGRDSVEPSEEERLTGDGSPYQTRIAVEKVGRGVSPSRPQSRFH